MKGKRLLRRNNQMQPMEVVETLNRANQLLKTGLFEKIFGGF